MVRFNRSGAVFSIVTALLAGSVGFTSAPAAGNTSLDRAPQEPLVLHPAVNARELASNQARVSGQKVAVEEMTTETTKVWATPDGKYESVIASGPVRFKRDSRWTEVDLKLRKRPDGTVAPGAHLNDLVLSGARDSGESDLASIATGGARRAMRWSGRLPEPVLDGNKATYPEVFPGVDLVVEVMMTGYEQFTVVKNRDALAHVAAAQSALKLGDAASKSDGEGGLIHNSGVTPAPLMWDAAIDSKSGKPKNLRKVELSPTAKGFGLSADRAWLNDPARKFPITIDPSDQGQWTSQDTWVKSDSTTRRWTGYSELEVGTQNGGGIKRIAYVNFTAQGMANATIHYADIKMWGVYAATCDNYANLLFPAWGNVDSNTYWGNRPGLISNTGGQGTNVGGDGNGDAGAYAFAPGGNTWKPASGGCTGQWLDSEATGVFQIAANRGYWQFATAFTPYWDNTNAYYRRYKSYDSGTYPHAIVSWSFPPTLTSVATTPSTQCVIGSGRPVIGTAQPTLTATYGQSDNYSSNLEFEWFVTNGAKISGATASSVAVNQPGSVVVPAGHFADGGTYSWHVRAVSGMGVASGWSGWCEFTVDTWAGPVSGCPGTVTEKADFNGDGFVDKAIADPLKATGGVWESGAITIVDGKTAAQTTLDQNLTEVPDSAEAGDRFGTSTAIVDMNRDGCADLVVGTPFEDLTVTDAGMVNVLYGTPTGLGKGPAAETFYQGYNRIPGAQGGWDWFGFSLAAGQSGTDPFIVIGVPGEDTSGQMDGGAATYIRADFRVLVDQTMISGQSAETDDRFGYAVAATGNQVAISSPGESVDANTQFAGLVSTFKHSITSNKLDNIASFSQNDYGVAGREAGDEFGKAIAMAPYRTVAGGSIDSILLVGAPGEDNAGLSDVGVTHSYKVTSSAVSLLSTNWKTGGQTGDRFGEKLFVVNLDPNNVVTDAKLIAAVGAPGKNLNASTPDSGEIRVFPAGKTGTLAYDVAVAPGTLSARQLIGVSVGGNGTHLFAPSVYQGTRSFYAIKWADLVTGVSTVDSAHTVAAPSGTVAFGAQAW